MEKLNFPVYNFKLKKKNNKTYIFDEIRMKWIFLTPEEWVRQNFIMYIKSKGYPLSLMNLEKAFSVHGVKKRYDIVVYNQIGKVNILVECKSFKQKINNNHFDQIMKYNIELKSTYLAVSNGINHYFLKFDIDNKKHEFIEDLPLYLK